MPPPICKAAPSRPALPPNRWVMTVDTKISGTRSVGMLLPKWTDSMTAFVPLPSSLHNLYSPAMTTPPRGSRYSIHGWACRTSVAYPTPRWNAAPTKPPTPPTSAPTATHFSSAATYRPMWASRSFSLSMSLSRLLNTVFAIVYCIIHRERCQTVSEIYSGHLKIFEFI